MKSVGAQIHNAQLHLLVLHMTLRNHQPQRGHTKGLNV